MPRLKASPTSSPLSSPSFHAPPGARHPSTPATRALLLAQSPKRSHSTSPPVPPHHAAVEDAHPTSADYYIPPASPITNQAEDGRPASASRPPAAIRRRAPVFPDPARDAQDEEEAAPLPFVISTPGVAAARRRRHADAGTTVAVITAPPRPSDPIPPSSYMHRTHASATKTSEALGTPPGRRCASPTHRRRRHHQPRSSSGGGSSSSSSARRMASVPGQTGLMRLRTAGAATPARSKVTRDVLGVGKENGGVVTEVGRVKRSTPATPLRARPAAPLGRVLESLEQQQQQEESPTPRRRKLDVFSSCKLDAQSRREASPEGVSLSPSLKRKAVREVDSPDSPSKRRKYDSRTLSSRAPPLQPQSVTSTARRRNFYGASTDRNGIFQLPKLSRVGLSVTYERPLRSNAPMNEHVVDMSSSMVGPLPNFPTGYLFGALESAVEGLAPFMGIGAKRGGDSETEAGGTVVRRILDNGFDGEGEGDGDVGTAEGSSHMQEWVNGLESPLAAKGRKNFFSEL